MKPKKNPRFNLEKSRKMYFQTGLVFALGTTLMAFEWSTPFSKPELPEPDGEAIDIIDPIDITKRKVDKPKPLKKEKAKSTDIKPVTDIYKEVANNQSADDDKLKIDLDDPDLWGDEVGGSFEDSVFVKVESMPHFCSCSKYETNEEREACTEMERTKFFTGSVKYPVFAKTNRIQGRVFVYFVVDNTGKVINARVEKGVHPSLDKEALRVVNNLPCFVAGKQRGIPVSVSYYAPIKFVLKN